jgi:replicative DNA helicase
MVLAEARNGEVELPTGLDDLDKKIGGLGRSGVTVIAARPGMGKTTLATLAAETVALAGYPVAIFSLEMPRWQLALRMACARARASVHYGLNGWLDAEARTNVLRAGDDLARLPIWIDAAPTMTITGLRSKARMLAAKAGGRLGLIVVDYLQLMRGQDAGGRQTRDREVSLITAGAKQLAKELDCAVLLLSQLNRECEAEKDKRPRLAHLRESGGIEQDADAVVFIYRDEYYYGDKSEDQGIAELIVAKQRNGPTGSVKVGFLGPSTTFYNLRGRR